MSKKLKELQQTIKNIFARLDLFSTFLDSFLVEEQNEIQKISLRKRLEKTEGLFEEFESVQTELLLKHNDDETSQSRERFEALYFTCVAKAEAFLEKYNKPKTHSNNVADTVSNVTNIKLPQINLIPFENSYAKWPEFSDSFKNSIDKNASLSPAQKLTYLKSLLKGEAASEINSLELTNSNYSIAWDRLEKRYNNKRRIIYDHIQNILDIPVQNKESLTHLNHLLTILQNNLDCLKIFDLKVEEWDPILVPILISKLDAQTTKEWELNLNSKFDGKYIPKVSELVEYLRIKRDTLEASKGKGKSIKSFVTATPSNISSCIICQKGHQIYNCESFLKLSINERSNKIKSVKACLCCLKKGHFSNVCKSNMRCAKCKGRHNTLLHVERQTDIKNGSSTTERANSNLNPAAESFQSTANFSLYNETSETLLSTACVLVIGNNKTLEVRAILDSASQSNFITRHMQERLNLVPKRVETSIRGVNGGQAVSHEQVSLTIKSKHNDFKVEIDCLILDEIISNLPSTSLEIDTNKIPSNIKLADPSFNISAPVDLLVGANIFYNLLCIGQIKSCNFPTLQKTVFGWVVSGNILPMIPQTKRKNKTYSFLTATDLHQKVEQFWNVDEFKICKRELTIDERYCEQYFKETTLRDEQGKFIVKIPFKNNYKNLLGNSEQAAKKRFASLENRFKSNSNLKAAYSDFMNEYIKLGHMVKLNEPLEDGFFLPHHAVINDQSETTKLRVVFDGSCKLDAGLPINQVQLAGPTIQNELFEIIAKFRTFTYAITADIKKMYRQVWIHPSERKYQQIFWRSNPTDPLEVYALNTVTYGTTSAAFLAIRSLNQLAHENENLYTLESKIIRDSFYVDDVLFGANSISELKNIRSNLEKILDQGGFELSKWYSNVSNLSINNENIQIGESLCKKLGVWWDVKDDALTYNVNLPRNNQFTKRAILSLTSQLFDPLGFLAPIIISAKILLQELWKLQIDWDDSVPMDIGSRWLAYKNSLKFINDIKIPRCVIVRDAIRFELHAFSDASEKGYGTCLYLKSVSNNETMVHLIAAKSRVAPIKCVTLPRLELCAAVLSAQLASKFCKCLELNLNTIRYWSDSTIVLGWIRSCANNFQTYVSNRITEIQALTNPMDWRHVDSENNPADLVSRGVFPKDLVNNPLWWHGPAWLENLEITDEVSKEITCELLPEQKRVTLSFPITVDKDIFSIVNFSSLSRLKHTVAYCLRFVKNARSKIENRLVGPLSVVELSNAMLVLAKESQSKYFSSEIASLKARGIVNAKSKLLCLSPFLDKNGIIRVGGRLSSSKYAFDKKFPIIINKDDHLTSLIFKDFHLKLLHAGPTLLLSSIREQYWPLNGRNQAKKTVRECLKCHRFVAKPVNQIMGNLPKERIEATYPFHTVGVDYGGPYLIKDRQGRGAKTTKAYICLFVCFSIKAVHIELVTDLSTQAFIMALKRFTARRGKPAKVYSDNATNFIGANRELQELYKFMQANSNEIIEAASKEAIEWHFIPPRAPNFGGLWEAAIKSVKFHLKRILQNVPLTYEHLNSLLIQVESLLNSRPLCPLSPDPSDLQALTPAHFLIGRTFTSIPEKDFSEIPQARLTKFEHIQQLNRHFWKRWHKEYISEMQRRSKWYCEDSHLKEGDLVLIKEENLPPAAWRLGRVVHLYPGADLVPRVADIKCQFGTIKRSISKICPLPSDSSEKKVKSGLNDK